MRGIFTAAANILIDTQTKMGLWQEMNGWLVPKLSPLPDAQQSLERLFEFRLAGTFIALHTIVLKHPISKVSPHVNLLLFCGSCPPDQAYISAADSSAASILSPWFAFMQSLGSTTTREPSSTADIRHLLAEYLGEPVCSPNLRLPLRFADFRQPRQVCCRTPTRHCGINIRLQYGIHVSLVVDRSKHIRNGRHWYPAFE
jgi:hypothetical protein